MPSMLRKMDQNALHQAVPVVEGRKIVAKSQLDSSLPLGFGGSRTVGYPVGYPMWLFV